MHAIVRQGDGKFYVSAVFGYYRDVTAAGGYEEYLQSITKPYWIVWDADGKRLVRWLAMTPDTKSLIPQILIVDSDRSNWTVDEQGVGCVDFLSRELLDSFLDAEVQPPEILEKCRQMDSGYAYADIREVKTEKDVEDLMWAAGSFHDARIVQEEAKDDGTLHVRFDGTWGCQVELWFCGDVEYDTSSRNPQESDPYWSDSTVILKDGFVYLVDDCDMTVDKINSSYCYFKARQMQYRIIPD